ncbi:MAG TPA: universal stress protein [Jiangellaceae bacterium]|nr:universal stress protein [Jiangellaceae bacterium]
MFRRILVAVDDAPAAFHAAEVAIGMAAATGGTIVAITVLQDHALDERISAASMPVGGRRVLAANATLRHVQRRAAAAGVAADTIQVSGAAAAEVLAESRRSRADVIVIARASQRGVGVPYVGVEAQRILEFSDLPVLVVPPPAR